MGCHGGFALDEATRREWYRPESILQGLRAGMVFADIGCGDGFFSVLAAKIVGAKGKVYSVDIDASAIERLTRKAKAQGLNNITAKVAATEDTVFCNKCTNMVFYSMVLHDFKNPETVLINARKMVKPDGLLVDLDWKKIRMPFGPPVEIRFSEKKASSMVEKSGFKVESIKSAGQYHYVVTAKPC